VEPLAHPDSRHVPARMCKVASTAGRSQPHRRHGRVPDRQAVFASRPGSAVHRGVPWRACCGRS